jgi:DNA-binding MarR family transcriptional regulator
MRAKRDSARADGQLPDAGFTANLVTAFADRLAELMGNAAAETAGSRGEATAAIIALRHEPGMSIRRLADVLGIAQPTCVTMTERLRETGLVDRRSGPDARTAALFLTAEGSRSARNLLRARHRIAERALSALDSGTRTTVHAALVSMLESLTTDRVTGDHICRRCDEFSCPDELCPVERALRSGP